MTTRNHTRAEKVCEVCQASFSVPHYRKDTARFCAPSCRASWMARTYLNTGPKPWAAKNLDGHRRKSTSRFKPGHRTWNKDVKGIHLSPTTEFQKGRESETKAEIGEIRIRHFTDDSPRAFIKVAQPNHWRALAIVVWEEINGPLPVGCVVHHKDRDTLNDDTENLQAMTRAEHLEEHRGEFRRIPQPPKPKQEALDL